MKSIKGKGNEEIISISKLILLVMDEGENRLIINNDKAGFQIFWYSGMIDDYEGAIGAEIEQVYNLTTLRRNFYKYNILRDRLLIKAHRMFEFDSITADSSDYNIADS